MSIASIAAKEGLPHEDIEIINVEERQVNETTVEVITTYRIRKSGFQRLFTEFLEGNKISDARIILALKCDLVKVISEGWADNGRSQRSTLNQVWESTKRTYKSSSFPDYLPPWFMRRKWSAPVEFQSLDLGKVPNTPGVYGFTPPGIPILVPGMVLYVGAAGVRGADRGLRDRLAEYGPTILKGKATKHSGAKLLAAWGPELWIHWAPCHPFIVNDIEGGLIDHLMPQFNSRDERQGLPDDYDEDLGLE
jgi:hypothetical protein